MTRSCQLSVSTDSVGSMQGPDWQDGGHTIIEFVCLLVGFFYKLLCAEFGI